MIFFIFFSSFFIPDEKRCLHGVPEEGSGTDLDGGEGMKVLRNTILPVEGFVAINLFGVAFVRKGSWDSLSGEQKEKMLRHEAIHTAQMKELFFFGFYVAYFFEWLFRLVLDNGNAYRNLSFEKEAYRNEGDPLYLEKRRHFAQWRKPLRAPGSVR